MPPARSWNRPNPVPERRLVYSYAPKRVARVEARSAAVIRAEARPASQKLDQALVEAEGRFSKDVWIARAKREANEAALYRKSVALAPETRPAEVDQALRHAEDAESHPTRAKDQRARTPLPAERGGVSKVTAQMARDKAVAATHAAEDQQRERAELERFQRTLVADQGHRDARLHEWIAETDR